MKGALRAACHLAVALWVGVYLAWSTTDPAPGTPGFRARVEPLPEAREPAAAALPPEPLRVGRREIAAGEALLADGGAFPILSLSYESFPSFGAYAEAMRELGARFVVVRQRAIVAEVDPGSGALVEAGVDARFSPRARDYTAEPGLGEAARRARDRFGRDAEVMMLVPRRLDAGLFGGIARELARRGEGHEAYREIRGRYERAPGGGVHLRIQAGERRDGSRVALDLVFDLSAITHTPRA